MRNLIYFLVLIIGWMVGTEVRAQADASLVTRWYNRGSYNPAAITQSEFLNLFTDFRQQWTGIEGAPQVFSVQASKYIDRLNAGFGISLAADKTGATQAFNPMLSYAYRITNNRDWHLSLGLSAGVFSRSVNGSLFEAATTIDPAIGYDVRKVIRPDANAGIEFQNPHFIISFSSTHLFSLFNSDSLLINTNHRFGSIIYQNADNPLVSYFVGMQAINRGNLTIYEGSICLRFKHRNGLLSGPKELFDLGLAVGSGTQLSLWVSVKVTPLLRIGYAYNQSFIVGYYPNGSHEVMLELGFL
jgi:type IX secretion system PorP/SprF family membrane protein